MSKWIIILSVLIMIALFITIYFIGWTIGFKEGMQAGDMTRSYVDLTLFNDRFTEQLQNATCEGLKKSLNDYLMVLDKYRDGTSPLITETTYWGDVMITHTRLSRIDKKMGNESSSRQHLQTALNACAQRGWKECSEDKLIEFTKRLEKKFPMACLSDD
jgi:hypothetical protein